MFHGTLGMNKLSLGRSTNRVFISLPLFGIARRSNLESQGRPEMLKREFKQTLKPRPSVEPHFAISYPSLLPHGFYPKSLRGGHAIRPAPETRRNRGKYNIIRIPTPAAW
jgi:hypothetical protein